MYCMVRKQLDGGHTRQGINFPERTTWCICGRCHNCKSRCLCRCCSSDWRQWICPQNQSRLNVEKIYLCEHSRWSARSPDTWTTRKALFGISGQNFETVITVYRANRTCGICLLEDCVGSTCEECRQEVRASLGNGEEARVCWPCYAVILLQLGDALHSLAGDSVLTIVQYLDAAAETDLLVLQYRRHAHRTADAGTTYAKAEQSSLGLPPTP